MFENIYANRNVLITGHTGFKGSWLALWLKQLNAKVFGFSLDVGTSPSHFKLLNLGQNTQFGDVRDIKKLTLLFKKIKPEIVFHLAAQSLVRESYRKPVFTYETNIIGTLNVFEAAKKCKSTTAIINVTSDKVYENMENGKAFRETDRLGGFDMYSSSKACSEILSTSYRNSFLKDTSILLASVRAGNVIGGGDWSKERLIPDLMSDAFRNKMTILRNPSAIRPWQHVLEPLSGYLLLGQKLLQGKSEFAQAWNFGPEPIDCKTVSDVAQRTNKVWSKVSFKKITEKPSLQEAKTLTLDCKKSFHYLKWKPIWNLDKAVYHTASWYKKYYEKNIIKSKKDLLSYIKDAKRFGAKWTG